MCGDNISILYNRELMREEFFIIRGIFLNMVLKLRLFFVSLKKKGISVI